MVTCSAGSTPFFTHMCALAGARNAEEASDKMLPYVLCAGYSCGFFQDHQTMQDAHPLELRIRAPSDQNGHQVPSTSPPLTVAKSPENRHRFPRESQKFL